MGHAYCMQETRGLSIKKGNISHECWHIKWPLENFSLPLFSLEGSQLVELSQEGPTSTWFRQEKAQYFLSGPKRRKEDWKMMRGKEGTTNSASFSLTYRERHVNMWGHCSTFSLHLSLDFASLSHSLSVDLSIFLSSFSFSISRVSRTSRILIRTLPSFSFTPSFFPFFRGERKNGF